MGRLLRMGRLMDRDFWHQRWETGQIGFHQDRINLHLQRFWGELGLPAGETVFVPLCGKSRDMLWLREQGHPVLGVELSPVAVRDFFAENGLQPQEAERDRFSECAAPGLRILCGDFFDLRAEDLAGIGGVYDRASLIALPPPMRERYAAHMKAVLPATCRVLLVTFEYPQQEMDGPPFSVSEPEVRALYEPDFAVRALHAQDILSETPRFREKGLSALSERVYVLTRADGT